MVTATYRPYDVAHFRSRDAAAAVLLANSLDWTVLQRENGPVQLIASDGKQIRVPDNTGIKMDIFRGWIHQIATHTTDLSIDRKLVDQIVKTTKLGREHARLMYELAEDDLGPDDYGPVEKPEIGPLPKGTFEHTVQPMVLTREPHVLPRMTDPAWYVRTWSDDHVDWECALCDRLFDTMKGVAAHRQFHLRRGHVEGKGIVQRSPDSGRRTYIPPDETDQQIKRGHRLVEKSPKAEPVRMIEVSEQVITDSLDALKILEQIKALLGAGELSALKDELAVKDARIAQLEGNLRALRDLLGEV